MVESGVMGKTGSDKERTRRMEVKTRKEWVLVVVIVVVVDGRQEVGPPHF